MLNPKSVNSLANFCPKTTPQKMTLANDNIDIGGCGGRHLKKHQYKGTLFYWQTFVRHQYIALGSPEQA
jgi:hypothetical protein